MSELTAFRRGRVLLPPLLQPDARHSVSPAHLRFVVLLCLLPLFGQVFHYLIDLPILYVLSKAWPVLTLPLALYALVWLKLPYKLLYVAMLAYVLGVTPALSMIHLGNALFDALATTVKVLPFTYYLSLSAVLLLLSPRVAQLRTAFVALGAATFVIMILLWVLMPADQYSTTQANTKLLIYDVERGPRIYMPMFFGMFFLFYLMRRFGRTRQFWLLLPLIVGFVSLVEIYKQRTAIAAALLVVAYGFIMSTRPRVRFLLITLSLLIGAVAAGIWFSGPFLREVTSSFGGSLAVRQNTVSLVIHYLSVDAWRWLFGVGSITRFSDVTLSDIFGTQLFFLADIGWIGVVFEYGVVGALLIAAVYFVALRTAWRAAETKDPFAQALGDYVLYLFLTSTIYSVVFTPGEVACVMATALYLLRHAAQEKTAQQPGHAAGRPGPRAFVRQRDWVLRPPTPEVPPPAPVPAAEKPPREHPYSVLRDPRQAWKADYLLSETLLLPLGATLAGAVGPAEIERWGRTKLGFLRSLLPYANGIPTARELRDILGAIDPVILADSLQARGDTRPAEPGDSRDPLDAVSVWAAERRLAFSQASPDNPAFRTSIARHLLTTLPLDDALVVGQADEEGALAQTVLDQGGHYLLLLRNNRHPQVRRLLQAFGEAAAEEIDSLASAETRQRRRESRQHYVMRDRAGRFADLLPGLSSVALLEVSVWRAGISSMSRYVFLSSLPLDAHLFSLAVRDQFNLAQRPYWSLDILFPDGQTPLDPENARRNMSAIRQTALAALKAAPGAESLRARRRMAAWDEDYLRSLIERAGWGKVRR